MLVGEMVELNKGIQGAYSCLSEINQEILSTKEYLKELQHLKELKQKSLTLMEVQRESAFQNVTIVPRGRNKKSPSPKLRERKAPNVVKVSDMASLKKLIEGMSDEAKAKFLEGLLQS